MFEKGEKVRYKKESTGIWHGPGVVIGRDGTRYVVKHGLAVVKVHSCHISRESTRTNMTVTAEDTETDDEDERYNQASRYYREEIHQEFDDRTGELHNETKTNTENEETEGSSGKKILLPKVNTDVLFRARYPEEGEAGAWEKVFIHSRAGKATGKYKNCFNIQLDGENAFQCVDWTELAAEWKYVVNG